MFRTKTAIQKQQDSLAKQLNGQLRTAGLWHKSIGIAVLMVRVDGTDKHIPEYVISIPASLTLSKNGERQSATQAIKTFMSKQTGSLIFYEVDGREQVRSRPAWTLVKELELKGGNVALLYRLYALEPRPQLKS